MANKINKDIFERSTTQPAKSEVNKEVKQSSNVKANNNKAGIDSAVFNEVGVLIKAIKDGKLDTRANLRSVSGEDKELLEGINEMLDAVIGPLNTAAEYVHRIGKGDIPEKITAKYQGGFNDIKNNLNACIDGLGGLAECSEVLGKMAVNDYTSKVQGKYMGIFADTAESVNQVRDHLLLVQGTVDNISTGDLKDLKKYQKIGKRSEDDNLMPAFIALMENIQVMAEDANLLAQAAVEGQLNTRVDASKHGGVYGQIVEGVNATLDAVIGPLNVAADYVDRISKGDIPPKITDNYNGDFNKIKNNLNTCIDAVNNLVEDANLLAQAAVEGRLDTRADASKHGGDFKAIVEGVNATLDAVIGPLNVAADYVDRISKGDIPQKIMDNYNGDFNEIKNNLNTCIDAVNELVADANLLAKAAVEGRLDTRADASKHGGDFKAIVEGVNATLDAVIGPLNVAADYVDRISKGDIPEKITDSYNGDFNEIKNNLNTCIDAVNNLVEDANLLAQAAVEGRLDTRADASKHGGTLKP